jgi:O-antigen ligase
MKDGQRALGAVPAMLGLLLGWCLLTALWAPAPGVALRRAGLEIIITVSAMLSVQTVGPERALRILRALLAAILVVNFASILLVHQAVHLSDETDPQLIGNWRGLYYHKNITGAVCSITALLFFFRGLDSKRGWDWLVFGAAVLFTVMTRSKTSLGLLPVGIVAGLLFRGTRPESLNRWILVTAGALAAGAVLLALIADFHAIERFLTDPTELTGRVAIWEAELAFIRDHPLLGSGFGSFADTGQTSPLYNYVADKWVQGEAHGHNAYLQMCLTIGGVGFVLAMLAFVVQPLRAFGRIKLQKQIGFFAPLFAVFVFILLHNFVESDFLEGDGPAWVAFLLMLACLHAVRTQRSPPQAPVPWSAP